MAIAGELTAGREVPPAKRAGFDAKWIFIAVSVAIVAYLGLVPLVFLLWQSFFTPETAA
jgi:iron(III) transport system permease protein